MPDSAGEHLPSLGVVVVTHDSEKWLGTCLDRLFRSDRRPDQVVVVDNASTEPSYLDAATDAGPVTVVRSPTNVGFSAANNVGLRSLDTELVLFLNPDAFVEPDFVRGAVARFAGEPALGALGPKLIGCSRDTFQPTGRIDSVGIAQRRYGRVFDIGRGEVDRGQYDRGRTDVPAVCAAAMLCRRVALDAVGSPAGEVFDESFFMYKEDVDLSYRIRRAGWRVAVDTDLAVLHCRGWADDRAAMPSWARRMSVRNEWRLWRKGVVPARIRVPMLAYLVVKSVAVALGR